MCFSIRRKRWRTVFGWQISTSAAPRTDASLSCHTRNVSKSISRSSSGRSAKTVQRSADRFDHRLRRADRSGGQDGAVEHRDRGCGIGRAPQHHPCDMQGSWRIAQILEGRTDAHPHRRHPRHQAQQPCRVFGRTRRARSRPANQAAAATPKRCRGCAASTRSRAAAHRPRLGTWAAMTTNGPLIGSRSWPATSPGSNRRKLVPQAASQSDSTVVTPQRVAACSARRDNRPPVQWRSVRRSG